MYYNVRLRCLHVGFVLREVLHILTWPIVLASFGWYVMPHENKAITAEKNGLHTG